MTQDRYRASPTTIFTKSDNTNGRESLHDTYVREPHRAWTSCKSLTRGTGIRGQHLQERKIRRYSDPDQAQEIENQSWAGISKNQSEKQPCVTGPSKSEQGRLGTQETSSLSMGDLSSATRSSNLKTKHKMTESGRWANHTRAVIWQAQEKN
jgi:hypothetical protein